MLPAQVVLFIHVASAIVLVGGSVASNVLGGLARRAGDLERRRTLVAAGAPFSRMTTIAVPVTTVTGLITLYLFGYSVTELWVLGTGAVILVLAAIQILYWNKVAPQIHEALNSGDDDTAVTLMRDPKGIAFGRLEVGLGFLIVALMVIRPR